MREIRRVFQYHGAEHKTINAYEAGVPLDAKSVMEYPKAHVRCGTSFVLVVLVCSIVVLIAIADYLPHGTLAEKTWLSYWVRWGYKLALLPLVLKTRQVPPPAAITWGSAIIALLALGAAILL